MSADAFFDSNILLYEFEEADLRKQQIAATLIENAIQAGSAIISYQVAQEVLNTLTRKFHPPISADDAMRYLADTLEPLWRVQPSADLIRSGVSIRFRYGFSFYDSLIVAAALSANCSRLLTEDLNHGQRIEGLTIVNPFLDGMGYDA